MDQVTLREFDRLCLPPVEALSPRKIKKIRETSHVSQAVFAALLNTSVSTVQKWEIGKKRPTDAIALLERCLARNFTLGGLSYHPVAKWGIFALTSKLSCESFSEGLPFSS